MNNYVYRLIKIKLMKNIFQYQNLRSFLYDHLKETRGSQAQFAKNLGCGSSFISQVLQGIVELSPEQGLKAAKFFGLSEGSLLYFMLLLQHARAGNAELKLFYEKQLHDVKNQSLNVEEHIGKKEKLSEKDKITYYSSWHYAAIHIATSIIGLNSPENIAKYFKLDIQLVQKTLQFLVQVGLVEKCTSGFRIGKNRIHIGPSDQMIKHHHTHWRLKAIASLEASSFNKLHFSSVLAVSKKDLEKIKLHLLEAIKSVEKVIVDSPEEDLAVLNIDFFDLKT